MNTKKFMAGAAAVLLCAALTSCGSMFENVAAFTAPPQPAAAPAAADGAGEGAPPSFSIMEGWTYKSGYSWFTQIPSKEYSVVGIVVAREDDRPVVALMEAAQKLGADEVLNIRLDTGTVDGKEKVLAASGVAIKYQAGSYTGLAEVGDAIVDSGAVRWSKYSRAPSKDFAVVRIVTVKGENITTPAADLMDAAKALGAHDIINARIDTADNTGAARKASGAAKKIIGASALAITYTNTTYKGPASATAGSE